MVTKDILIYDLRSTIYEFGEAGARGLFLFEGLNENKGVVNFRFGGKQVCPYSAAPVAVRAVALRNATQLGRMQHWVLGRACRLLCRSGCGHGAGRCNELCLTQSLGTNVCLSA